MAFDVTPTSGAGPYTFTASYADRLGIDLGLYAVMFTSSSSVGSCPTGGIGGSPDLVTASALYNTGTAVTIADVPSGSCRRYSTYIRRLSDNAIVSQMSAFVDNV